MSFKRSDSLGKYYWYAKEHRDSYISTSGMDKCWRDKDATVDELRLGLPDEYRDDYTFLYLQTYKKVGRKIERVRVREIELDPETKQVISDQDLEVEQPSI